MGRSISQLKQAACEAIDKRHDEIIALGDSIFSEPELGYKEVKTSAKVKKLFDELGYEHTDGVALTGVIAPRKGRSSKLRVAVMGELDAVVAPGHPNADKVTGAAHACGHNAMIAALSGVAYALKDADIMSELDGDVVLMAVPAEEYVEIGYRDELRKEGKITFLGGKQEFIKLGAMDDIDIMVMQHTESTEHSQIKAAGGAGSTGFCGKLIHYIGKEAHAGGAPHLGINALNAANIGLMAVNMQRETFQDADHIRVHPIITKGGDLVNVVPADVRLETYVRGANVEAILDASRKVNRAFEAGAYAVGAKCEITEIPGYLPTNLCDGLLDLMYENLKTLLGEEHTVRVGNAIAGSSDAGDISYLMPTVQAWIGGGAGNFHSEDMRISDKEMAYITAAKALTMTVIDLLADGARTGLSIKESFKAPMTKEQYLKEWGGLED